MPLDRLVLIIVAVLAAATVTVYVGFLISAAATVPAVAFAVIPVLTIGAYICVRVIRDRTTNAEDDHYDKIER